MEKEEFNVFWEVMERFYNKSIILFGFLKIVI